MEPRVYNVGEILRHWADIKPNHTAYIFLEDGESQERLITYGELHNAAVGISTELLKNCRTGDRILLIYPAGLEFIKAFFGCMYAGMIAVPTYVPPRIKNLDHINNLIADSSSSMVCTCDQLLPDLERLRETRIRTEHGERPMAVLSTEGLQSKDMGLGSGKEGRDNCDIAFLQYTSGSTSQPKGVVVSHQNIIDNELIICAAFNHDENTIGMGWLPHYHDMGLIGNILQTMFIGRPCILMSPLHFIQRPIRWLKAISKYKATSSGGPNFAYELCIKKCRNSDLDHIDLSSWKTAFTGAEVIRPDTIRRFADRFSVFGFGVESLMPCYGLAESTLFVTGKRNGETYRTLKISKSGLRQNRLEKVNEENEQYVEVVGCGFPRGDHQVVIVDPETKSLLPEGTIGEIWIAGKSVAQGYWRNQEISEQAFKAEPDPPDGRIYLRSGDLGFTDQGELFVTGRVKEIVVIRGQNYHPYDIEETVSRVDDALVPLAAAVFSDERHGKEVLGIIQEVDRTKSREADLERVVMKIRSAVLNNHGIAVDLIVLVKPMAIPRTSSGKIRRAACRDSLNRGTLREILRWSASKDP